MHTLTRVAGAVGITLGVLSVVPAAQLAAGAPARPGAAAPVVAAPVVPEAAPAARDIEVHAVHPRTTAAPVRVRPPAAKPRAAKVAAKPHVTTHHAVVHHYPSGPTSWGALNAAIARIPTYHAGQAHWVVRDTGWWGTADWNTGVIYVSHSVPESKLYDVAVHEWSHILTTRDYGNNPTLAIAATTAYFGGAGLNGAEYAADCMAILQGADWTNYTSCTSAHWRAGAQALIDGHRLPGISVG